MRIGLISSPWLPVPPTAYGGTELVVDELARGLTQAGHDVLLWTTGDSTCPVPRGARFAHSMPDQIGETAIELEHVTCGYDALAGWGADIVHDHTVLGPRHAARHPELRVVATVHGPFAERPSGWWTSLPPNVTIVAISADHARRARGVPITAVIHHGIDVSRYPVGAGTGDADGPYFCFVGRMSPEKGVEHAIRAARRAGVRLLVAAKMRAPGECAYFEAQIRPLLGEGVVFLGEVGFDEKVQLLGAARALLNPIQWPEPFGLVMVESLACGTPVIAGRTGSAPELLAGGAVGLLADGDDELVGCIARVGELDRDACRRTAVARFGRMAMVERHLALYQAVMLGQPSAVVSGERAHRTTSNAPVPLIST